jgi:hypothetical protein
MNKIIFVVLIILSLSICEERHQIDNDEVIEDPDSQYVLQILKDYDLHDKAVIDKNDFKRVFFKLLIKEEEIDDADFYMKVIDRYIENVPDKILTRQIADYIDF